MIPSHAEFTLEDISLSLILLGIPFSDGVCAKIWPSKPLKINPSYQAVYLKIPCEICALNELLDG